MRLSGEMTGAKRGIALQTILYWLILLLALALGGWHVWCFGAFAGEALTFRYPLDGLEGTLLSEARLLRAGESLYQPIMPDRFISSPYQPLSYLALVSAEYVAYSGGAPPADVTQGPIFLPGRVVSLVALLSAGILIGIAGWRLARSWVALPLATVLWLAFPPVMLWATRIKPDPLALCFTAAGMAITASYLVHWPGPGAMRARFAEWRLISAAFFFACAYFTKQTALAAPLAVGLTLLISGWMASGDGTFGRRLVFALRAPLIFGGSYLLLVGLSWALLEYVTARQYTAHVLGMHRTEWWSFGLFRKYLDLLLLNWPLLIAGGLAVALWVYRRPGGSLRRPGGASLRGGGDVALLALPALYLLIALPGLLAAGTEGAHHNHLLEPYLALILAAVVLVARRPGAHERRPDRLFALLGLLLIVGQLWVLRETPPWYRPEFDLARQERGRYIELIQSQPGEVLADDVALLFAAGRPLRYDDPSTMGPAARIGLWDESNLLADVAAQRFSLILLPFNAMELDSDPSGRWSPQFIARLRAHYTLLYRDEIYSYVPVR